MAVTCNENPPMVEFDFQGSVIERCIYALSRDCLQIRVVRNLISHGVKSSQISVLTPYSAQRAKISRALQAQMSSCDSEVLSVFASQGMYFCLPVNTTLNSKVLLSGLYLNDHTLRISSTNSNVRTTLYSIINSTTGKYCSVAFI